MNIDKITIKNLNNNFEMTTKWQPQLQWTLDCSTNQFLDNKCSAYHSGECSGNK